jgi:hypothetical protein
MSQPLTIAEAMGNYALEAVNLAQAVSKRKLDFSEESVKVVEAILSQLHTELPREKRKPLPEVIDQVCNVYGAYIGEVMRRTMGGEWVLDDKMSPGNKIISLRLGNTQTCPSAKVYKRIMNGSEDDVWFYYRVLVERSKGNGNKSL